MDLVYASTNGGMGLEWMEVGKVHCKTNADGVLNRLYGKLDFANTNQHSSTKFSTHYFISGTETTNTRNQLFSPPVLVLGIL